MSLLFEGRYHGRVHQTLVRTQRIADPTAVMKGLPAGIEQHARIVPFNDIATVEAVFASGRAKAHLEAPMRFLVLGRDLGSGVPFGL